MTRKGDRKGQKSVRPAKFSIIEKSIMKEYTLAEVFLFTNISSEEYKNIIETLFNRTSNRISEYLTTEELDTLVAQFLDLARFGITYKDIEYIYGYQINEKTIRIKVKEKEQKLLQLPIAINFKKYEFLKQKGEKYRIFIEISDNQSESKKIILSREIIIKIFLSRMLNQVIYLHHRKTKKPFTKRSEILRLKEYDYKK